MNYSNYSNIVVCYVFVIAEHANRSLHPKTRSPVSDRKWDHGNQLAITLTRLVDNSVLLKVHVEWTHIVVGLVVILFFLLLKHFKSGALALITFLHFWFETG